ncbi:dTDP-4-dehydrorhamnose reductase [Saccharopolyspora rhizosphaerae]|uniref:dTDP-4-dehydrorhamnose reductase n=1 Tax=Saccharopolyspora rhizosphaerae TaxID=2492662 RepID=A0A426JI22_9PSEU|nr:dTDP-4-dehydrorhamnose reductase [Saccharopolyspora rhizosphaerae]RRO12751.1 dTDP-4-dehydrorhamnose reductase [Saccharopolyspora rhizosphaerae]
MTRLAALVPGGKGQVGSELAAILGARRGSLVHAPGSAELDITETEAVRDAVEALAEAASDAEMRPVVINTAACTAVDAAESDPESAERVNVTGAAVLAEACREGGLPLLHVSTDYVFPGDADRPYEPTDTTGPRTVYGRTKLEGEQAVLESGAHAWVVRTAWVYGAHGGNFVKTMARLAAQRDELSVVDDQIGSPTWAADLAAGLLELAGHAAAGDGPEQRVLHCTNTGSTSWFEFARAIFDELGLDPKRVKPCSSAEYPTKTPRPAYSVLSENAWREAGLTPLRPWRDALREAFATHPEAFRHHA